MTTKLEHELGQLATLSREELCARWRTVYGCPPPEGVRRGLLLYAAGWHLQVKRSGGFSGETRRLLRREINQIKRERQPGKIAATSKGKRRPASVDSVDRRQPVHGDRLLREWNGKTHIVDVTDDGYLHDGRIYRSLTAIARQITGTHWSGPRFFGL